MMNAVCSVGAWCLLLAVTVYANAVHPRSKVYDGFVHHLDSDEEFEAILQSMNLREKVAQMTQLDIYSMMNGDIRDPMRALNHTVAIAYAKAGVGSILNCPFPGPMDGRTGWSAQDWNIVLNQIKAIFRQYSKVPMIYGIDTIHGATYVKGATLFGQPLSAASSFNTDLVYQMGEIEAKDTLRAGIPWVFSPVLGIAVQPLWSRVYETFGEDPMLAATMGAAIIRGIQSSGKVAACMKHFIGYSNPTDGLDRSDSVISEWDLVNYYAPPFRAAIQEANVQTAMETYVSINGEPVIASHKTLVDLLRKDMQFHGMLVSDYSEIDRMVYEHHVASTLTDAVRISLTQTSLDMNMGPDREAFADTVEKLVHTHQLHEARLDASVRRILKLKKRLGLLEEHQTGQKQSSSDWNPQMVGNPDDQQVALDLARESIILLVNRDATLPISLHPPPTTQIFLTGPIADNKGYMCGGWSVYWQGSSDSSHFPNGKTIKEAIAHEIAPYPSMKLTHKPVVDIDGKFSSQDWNDAMQLAASSAYTIVVVGEWNYAEKTGDIDDLSLPAGQVAYIKALSRIPTTKVIVIVITGRPRLLRDALDQVDAMLLNFLPCEQGGQAIAETLFGRVNPSAKLPITYPASSGHAQLPYYHRVNTVCKDWQECEPQWPFGYGLSYSRIVYSNLVLNTTRLDHPDQVLQVTVTVTNHGPFDAKEAVLVFISQRFRHASVPEQRMLKHFAKMSLQAGQSTDVSFSITGLDWSYYVPQIGHGFQRQIEAGMYDIQIPASTPTKPTLQWLTASVDVVYNRAWQD